MGKIPGSQQKILEASIALGKEPKSPEELTSKIIQQMQEGLGEISEEAVEAFYCLYPTLNQFKI